LKERGRRTSRWPAGEAQQPGDGGDTGKPGKALDVAAPHKTQRLVHERGNSRRTRGERRVANQSAYSVAFYPLRERVPTCVGYHLRSSGLCGDNPVGGPRI
jgi:hypothetical protein